MNPYIVTLIWLVVIEIEAAGNWYMIERLRQGVPHKLFTVNRIIAGGVLCLAMKLVLPFDNWIVMPFMQALTFWFVFDISLNLMRGKSIFYFGQGSMLDRLQSKWPLPWVWFKFLAAAASVLLFITGISAVRG